MSGEATEIAECASTICCVCKNLSKQCIGRIVAETEFHRAVINKDMEKVWIDKALDEPFP